MAKNQSYIARIGVTGGIGSGKSIVCAQFERLGIPVLYADLIAREISDCDPEVIRKITALFGPGSYSDDGKLNRPYIASQVFSDFALQAELNAIVHPKVREELEKQLALVPASSPFVVIEAALIYEAGLDKLLDAVVVVDATEHVRVRRVVERDGVTAKEVRKRMKAQWSQEKKLGRAEFVIKNNGSLAQVESQVRFLYTVFVQRYQRV